VAHPRENEGSAITADEFLALHRQIAALVSLGLPIERHLAGWNRRRGRRLRKATQNLVSSLQKGEPLSEALARVDNDLSPIYRAVLESGAASGRAGLALQELSQLGQRILEIRGLLLSSLCYPLIVFLIAWAVLIFYLLVPFPILSDVVAAWGGQTAVFDNLNRARATIHLWGAIVPAVVLLLFLFWRFFLLRKSKLLIPRRAASRLGWFPGVQQLIYAQQNAILSDMLAVMVRQGVPLDRAVRNSGAIFGDRRLDRESNTVAEALASQDWQRVLEAKRGRCIPASLRLAIVQGLHSGRLADNLEQVAEHWKRQTWRQAMWIKTVSVPMAVVIFGSLCTLLVALLLWLPWLQIMFQMASFRA
jgi:type II secretory pathway component PulF